MANSHNSGNISATSITANDLILDLLATHETHELSVAALCRAGAVFGMTEQSVRVALTRLVRQGKVSNRARGLYAWNPAGSSLFRDVESWLGKEQRAVAWSGNWAGILDAGVPRRHRVAWRRHELAVELRGFQPFSEGLRLRPDNLEGGIDTLRCEIGALGLAPGAIVLGIHGLSPADDRRARQLWNAEALRAGYTKMHAWLERSEAKLDRLPPQAAAAETLLLGRTVIRHIVRDPLLPEELLPGGERQALIERMRSYQVRAREIWLSILQEG